MIKIDFSCCIHNSIMNFFIQLLKIDNEFRIKDFGCILETYNLDDDSYNIISRHIFQYRWIILLHKNETLVGGLNAILIYFIFLMTAKHIAFNFTYLFILISFHFYTYNILSEIFFSHSVKYGWIIKHTDPNLIIRLLMQ